ncbi:MAG: dihydroneopterin aldolase [Pseudomonadota bacterium]
MPSLSAVESRINYRVVKIGKTLDKIIIKKLKLETIIGLFPWERAVRQNLLVDLEMAVDISQAAASDDFHYVVNYAEVCERVAALADDGQFKLLETFVERIAAMILGDFAVSWVRVYVRKTDAVTEASTVGVEIERAGAETGGLAEQTDS